MDGIWAKYLSGDTDVPAIVVVGLYGQGKTLLLFHIFKSVLNQGGVAAYTHADLVVKLIETRVGKNAKILKEAVTRIC